MMKKIILFTTLLCSIFLNGQKISITGEVYNEYLEPFSGALIKTSQGRTVVSASDGTFTINVTLPVTIKVSADGYGDEVLNILAKDDKVSIILKEKSSLEEVVVSASRTPEKIFESPVTVERLGLNKVKNTPSENFYDGLTNLKGIFSYNNSKTIPVLNTRGFTNLRNVRFVQLVDGVDNISSVQSISLANVNSINELDVESVEILPGAASALYGANAFNGLILINSKNPFDYSGISIKTKAGISIQKNEDRYGNKLDNITKPFYDLGGRFAYAFSNEFAAKVSFSYLKAEEWHANDYRDFKNRFVTEGVEKNLRNGVNIYGDGLLSFKRLAYSDLLINGRGNNGDKIANTQNLLVTRTGYTDSEVADSNKASNLKFRGSLHYRPWGNKDLEIIWTSNFNTSSYLFQAPPTRYSVKDAYQDRHILELKGKSFFVRGYRSSNAFDKIYNHLILGNALTNVSASNLDWYKLYSENYIKTNNHDAAREAADASRLIPGTKAYQKVIKKFEEKLLNEGGAGVKDYSGFYHADANFNFSEYIHFADIQIGGSYRDYELDSNRGTVFTDYNGPIHISEYGLYTQIQKKFFDDRLKLVGSIRYDKSKNFKGNLSPRISSIFSFGENRNQNFRIAYQTAFRNPTIQDQYFGLKIGRNSFRVGNIDTNRNNFNAKVNDADDDNRSYNVNTETLKKSGFTAGSFNQYISTFISSLKDEDGALELVKSAANPSTLNILKTTDFNTALKPEEVQALEAGYKGIFNIADRVVELDINGYYNRYQNFITNKTSYIPLAKGADVKGKQEISNVPIEDIETKANAFTKALTAVLRGEFASITMPVNSTAIIQSYGITGSIKTRLFQLINLNLSYNWTDFSYEKEEKGFNPGFNTPNHSFKVMVGSKKIIQNLGFNIAYRWQDKFDWYSPYGNGVIDSQSILDAQVSYSVPALKSRFKIGGNNIIGKNYYTSIGSGRIGSTFFLSWIIND